MVEMHEVNVTPGGAPFSAVQAAALGFHRIPIVYDCPMPRGWTLDPPASLSADQRAKTLAAIEFVRQTCGEYDPDDDSDDDSDDD